MKAEACGKVILTGEHGVVYGAKAIALPLFNFSSSVELALLEGSQSSSHQILGLTEDQVPHLLKLIDDIFELFHMPFRSVMVRCATNLPLAAGLGASASLCVALIRSFAKLFKQTISPKEESAFANVLEKRFHGNPSGLDTAVIAFEKPILFQKGVEPSPLILPSSYQDQPWNFVLLDTKTRSSTMTMVEKAKPFFEKDMIHKVQAFDQITELALQGLSSGSLSVLKDAMVGSCVLLKEIGVVTPQMEELAKQALSCGILAVKPTGAGGGGYLLGLLPEAEKAVKSITTKLKSCLGKDSFMTFRLTAM